MPTPPSGNVPVGNPQTGYLVKSSDLATVKLEGLDKLSPDDDMKTMVAKLQQIKPTITGNAYRLNRILGEINARIGTGGGGAGSTTVVQVGGGGSGGVVVGNTGFWSVSGIFLFPTAFSTTTVLIGTNSSDFFGSPGQLGTTAAMGMMTGSINASLVYLFISPAIETQLVSNSSGTGTLLPLSFYCGGLRASISTGGVFYIGARTSDLSVGAGTVVSTKAFIVISATANASIIDLTISGGTCQLVSGSTGTGTILPISFNLNSIPSPFESARIRTGGSWLFGLQSSDVGDNLGWIVEQGVFGIVNATTNANALFLSVSGTTETVIHSSFSGAGTALPMSLYLSGVRYFTLLTSGALIGGAFTTDIAPTAGMIVLTSAYFLISATTNASTFEIHAGSGVFEFVSSSSGTGSIVPVRFSFGGTEVARFTTTGQFLIGFNSISADYSATSGRIIAATDVIVATATVNSSFIRMILSAGVETNLQSAGTGSGTVLPLSFYVSGTRMMTIATNGDVLIGLFSSDASGGVGNLYISNFFGILSATTNAHALFMSINGTTETVIHSSFTGTGTTLPLSLYTGGVRRCTVTTAGGFIVGELSSDFFTGHCLVGDAGSGMGLISAATNADVLLIRETSNLMQIDSSHSGTGTTRPLQFAMTESEIARFLTNGHLLIGLTSTDAASGLGDLYISSIFGILSATTNASALFLSINGTTETVIHSSFSGTGTGLPLSLYASGNRIATIVSTGQFMVGFLSAGDFNGSAGRIMASNDVVVATASTNAQFVRIIFTAGVGELESGRTGTGTFAALRFVTNAAEQARFTTGGAFLVGLTSTDFSNSAGQITASLAVSVVSAATNASTIDFHINGTTETLLVSSKTGTGTFLPLSFYTNNVRAWTIVTGGALISGSVTGGSYGGTPIGRVLTTGDFVITSGYTANESFLQINMNVGTENVINSSHIGTGSDLPISLYIGSVLRGKFDTTGRFLVGLSSSDSGGAGSMMSNFTCGVVSATANARAILMSVNGTTETVLHSTFSGTSASLPLSLYVNGIRGMTLTVANPVHVLIGTITDDGTGALLQVHGNISVNGTVLTVP